MSIKNIFRSKAPTPAPIPRQVKFADFDRVIPESKNEKAARRAGRVSVRYEQPAVKAASCDLPQDLQRPPRGRQAANRPLAVLDQLAQASTFEDFARILGNDLPAEPQQAPNAAARQLDQIVNAKSFEDIAKILAT